MEPREVKKASLRLTSPLPKKTSLKSPPPTFQSKKIKEKEEVQKSDEGVATETTKVAKVNMRKSGEKATIEVAKAPKVIGKDLPSIKDVEKGSPSPSFLR